MKSFIHSLLLLLSALTLTSCEKVIDVDIRNSDSKIVIEGIVGEGIGPHTVRVSESAPFNSSGTGNAVNRATVVIRSNAGQIDTLRFIGNGNYQTKKLVGVPGQSYILSVEVDGQRYVATSTMPSLIPLDKLTQEDGAGGQKLVMANYDDPAAIKNYYRFIVYVNDKRLDDIYVTDDRIRNGIRARTPVGMGPDTPEIEAGDRVRVDFVCIDAGVYDYLKSLADMLSGQSPAPANPNTNLSGGALGYFSAQTSSTNAITIR